MSAADELIDVKVEIPRGSRNKYSVDTHTGALRFDATLATSVVYPAEYGHVPDTLADDGDPLDALVLMDEPTFPGCLVPCRPVAVLYVQDQRGVEPKLICVEPGSQRYGSARQRRDVPTQALAAIRHFFEIYKELEPDKWAVPLRYAGRRDAWREIERSRHHPSGG